MRLQVRRPRLAVARGSTAHSPPWPRCSILSQQLLAAFVLLSTGSNETVGVVKGVQALAQLLCAVPAGCAADLLRRDRTLRAAGAVGVVAALITCVAFYLTQLTLIYAAFALWGAFLALCNPAMDALFADSVPSGQRSLSFVLKHVMTNVALVVSPFCAILLFWKYGNSWELDTLRPVLLFGALLAALAMIALFQFNDDFAFESRQRVLAVERELWSIERNFDPELSDCASPVSSDGGTPIPSLSTSSIGAITSPSEFSRLLQSPTAMSGGYKSPHSAIVEVGEGGGAECPIADKDLLPARPVSACCGLLHSSHVPYILFASDFVISNGMGLVTTYFPLFLYKEFSLSPIELQALLVLQPMCIAICSLFAQQIATCSSRMPVIVCARLIGTIALVMMTVLKRIELQCAMVLVREAFMQCTNPLRQSLLMDFVAKEYRARWNSLEGLSMFSWAGSAVLGGFVIDTYGYRLCFLAGAGVSILGTAMEAMLIPLTRHHITTANTQTSRH